MPIQQHPLPQDISSYRFRLIGDMTLKQFLYLASFILITILIHQSPIPFFFRYPLEILFLGLGIGLAFVPIQGRPLDQWIVAFIKSIYSPTQYTWQQTRHPDTDTGPALPQKLDHGIKTQLNTSPTLLSAPTTTPDIIQPSGGPTLRPVAEIEPASSTQKLPPQKTTIHTSPQPNPSEASQVGRPNSSQAPKSKGKPQTPTVMPSKPSPPNPFEASRVGGPPTANLPIPFTPDQPNTIVGLTLNPGGLILDGVLIEIISSGLTIRATKSNKLGQFLFAKALENGLYQIKAEKDGYFFTTYSIKLEGKIIKPLKIQAKSHE